MKMAFDADGAIQAAYIDFVQDCGAYPTPWPLIPAAAVGTFFPGPYRVPRGRLRGQDDLHEHRRARGVPRPVAVRVAGPRGAARHRGAPDGHRPRRAAPAQPAAPRRASVHEPQRHDLRQHLAARDLRAGARDARLRDVPRRAGRGAQRPAATSASGSSNYVEPSTPGYGAYGTETATIRIEPLGPGQRSTSPAARPETASRPRSCSSRPTRSARRSRTSTRSRATPPSPASARARPAAAARR